MAAELRAVLADVDVIALPTLVGPPPTVDGFRHYPLTAQTTPVNLAGHPALAMPVRSPGHPVPASLQLIGPNGQRGGTLRHRATDRSLYRTAIVDLALTGAAARNHLRDPFGVDKDLPRSVPRTLRAAWWEGNREDALSDLTPGSPGISLHTDQSTQQHRLIAAVGVAVVASVVYGFLTRHDTASQGGLDIARQMLCHD